LETASSGHWRSNLGAFVKKSFFDPQAIKREEILVAEEKEKLESRRAIVRYLLHEYLSTSLFHRSQVIREFKRIRDEDRSRSIVAALQ
jgi:recombinational DNA repair protein (RecF pathway)